MKQGIKLALDRQITGFAKDLFRSEQELIIKNGFLRQQMIALKRQSRGHLAITQQDRRVQIVLAQVARWKP